MARKPATDPAVASAAALVALASATPPKELGDLKKSLPRGSSIEVDCTARVRGVVLIGLDEAGSPGSQETVPASPPDLYTPDVMLALLDRLKVTPGRLRQALRTVTRNGPPAQTDATVALGEAVDQVADEIAEGLDPITRTVGARSGRSAAVRVQAQVELIET